MGDTFVTRFKSPGELLRELLRARGWTQEELALIIGKSRRTIMEISSDKSGVTPDMSVSLAAAFGNSPSDWLNLDTAFRLARVDQDSATIEKRARLFSIAPIRDMQRRGWINETTSVEELEQELKSFFSVQSLEEQPRLSVATKRTDKTKPMTPVQRAWCFRARQMASALRVKRFSHDALYEASRELRTLAAYPKEARHLPFLLGEYGIRFVVIEPLPGTRMDGAAFWLNEDAPVIAVSVRYDRVDSFWFTVMHEFFHIEHKDALSVDDGMLGENGGREAPPEDEAEQLADEDAASLLVPRDELESFIRRVGPLYSRQRIIQFAHRIRIHPGIIIGQLQHRKELGYKALRDMLAKVRSVVVEVALTDGWGSLLTPNTL